MLEIAETAENRTIWRGIPGTPRQYCGVPETPRHYFPHSGNASPLFHCFIPETPRQYFGVSFRKRLAIILPHSGNASPLFRGFIPETRIYNRL